MLTNVLVLVVLFIAVYFIAKEEKTNLQSWLNEDRTPMKIAMVRMLEFWWKLCKKPVRIAAIAVILVCQKSVWGMLVCAIILIGVSYYLVAKMEVLQKIEWDKEEVQKVATLATTGLATCWLFDKVELLSVVYSIVLIGVLVVGVIFLIWLLKFSKRNKTREADAIENEEVGNGEETDMIVIDAEVVNSENDNDEDNTDNE